VGHPLPPWLARTAGPHGLGEMAAVASAAAVASRAPRAASAVWAPPLRSAVRRIRTGYFPEDPDYIDPEGPLLAERLGARWRYMDDPTLRAPVLERNNVGMGMLVLNQPRGLDLPGINSAYTRLRDLEVNSLKRFVGITAAEPGPFCTGLDYRELLLAASASVRRKQLPRFSRALLWHHQELAHLVGDYRKPLVCQISGNARNGGLALASLASFSGAHEDSEAIVDACKAGLVPDGGLSYVLGRLKFGLGEFLALTGHPLRGADLVYAGLAKHWLSPDALPFLELTSEKHLEVSEADSHALLYEHSLPVPDGFRDKDDPAGGPDSLQRRFVPLVDRAFAKQRTVPQILEELQKISLESDKDAKIFAEECIQRMNEASPLALHATLRLIREARRLCRAEDKVARVMASDSSAKKQGQGQEVGGTSWDGTRGAFVECLRLEMRVQERLLCKQDAIRGLHARCLGRHVPTGQWEQSRLSDVIELDIDQLFAARVSSLTPDEGEDFAVNSRPDFPLSQHPRLRRYHPDFDPATGLDHDPVYMAAEVARWSPDFFVEERAAAVQALLDGADPAEHGLSRWVRVDSGA